MSTPDEDPLVLVETVLQPYNLPVTLKLRRSEAAERGFTEFRLYKPERTAAPATEPAEEAPPAKKRTPSNKSRSGGA
ncbi:MAG: hypothetical protein J2P17_14995 [Mycobacterium sp.]|nr:hypothetical protein [Mycobacterium sp.]